MLGEGSDQKGPWKPDHLDLNMLGPHTFYGLLVSLRGRLCRNADMADLYHLGNGRASLSPSLLATPAAVDRAGNYRQVDEVVGLR